MFLTSNPQPFWHQGPVSWKTIVPQTRVVMGVVLEWFKCATSIVHFISIIIITSGFTCGSVGKKIHMQCGGIPGFNPPVGRIPWRRQWQPTPNTFAWRTPWSEEQDRQQSVRSQSWTWLCDFLFHSSTSDHQAQISEVEDPCSRAHTSRSPWRGCFIPCLVIPRGGGVLARLARLCWNQGSGLSAGRIASARDPPLRSWIECRVQRVCTQPAKLRCWHGHFQPAMPVWSAGFKASACDSHWASDIQLSTNKEKEKG